MYRVGSGAIALLVLLNSWPLEPGALSLRIPSIQEKGELEAIAKRAKAAGTKEVTIAITPDRSDATTSADDYLRTKTVVVGVPIRDPVVVRDGDSVATITVVRVSQTLRVGPVDGCGPAAKSHGLRVRSGSEIAVAVHGGTVEVDGVHITLRAFSDAALDVGTSVLLIGWNCGRSTIELTHGGTDIFDVVGNNEVRYRGLHDFAFARMLTDLKNLPAIARYLKALR